MTRIEFDDANRDLYHFFMRMSNASVVLCNMHDMHRRFGRGAWVIVVDDRTSLLHADVEQCFFVPAAQFVAGFTTDVGTIHQLYGYDPRKGAMMYAHCKHPSQGFSTVTTFTRNITVIGAMVAVAVALLAGALFWLGRPCTSNLASAAREWAVAAYLLWHDAVSVCMR